MRYDRFFVNFGGSFRGKHCGKRGVAIPATSRLPKEFIRLDPWEGEYLWRIAARASIGVLEIGRRNGGSTFLLADATDALIVSIDTQPADDALLRALLISNGVGGNVDLVVGNSQAPRPEPALIDLLFIDGDHTYEGCKADILTWAPRVVPGGDIIFHDSYEGSYGVQRAALEFAQANADEYEVIVSPVIPKAHWTLPVGSIAHLMRRY